MNRFEEPDLPDTRPRYEPEYEHGEVWHREKLDAEYAFWPSSTE